MVGYTSTRENFDRNFYKGKLAHIFESATGKKVDRMNLSDIYEVVKYFHEVDQQKKEYKEFLRSLGIDYDQPTAVEVGVGPVDSIFQKDKTTIVSPYFGLFDREEGLTYAGDYMVKDGELVMVERSPRKMAVDVKPLDIRPGRIYITNNILNSINLDTWYKLAQKNEVVVGTFGLKTDQDIEKKRQVLREFQKEIEGSSMEQGTGSDCYFDIVHTRPRR